MADPMLRRGFLRGLASLPLVGGGVTLIGKPTAAAVPVTDDLFDRYRAWVAWEHAEIVAESEWRRYRHDPAEIEHAAWRWQDRRRWAHELYRVPDDPAVRANVTGSRPSTRAAVILSAAGVPLTGGSTP